MPAPIDVNRAMLGRAYAALGDLADELTLVGGCAAGLLIDDPGATPVRATLDVDLVVEATSYLEYELVGRRLRDLGFCQGGRPGDPICRWRQAELVLDVMPIEERILGFGNRWYLSAIRHRLTLRLTGEMTVNCIDAPHFLATKLEAFVHRGEGDVLASHDVEDLIRVVDGRSTLTAELGQSPADLRAFVGTGLVALLRNPHFAEALPAYFGTARAAQDRARIVLGRLRSMAAPAD